MVGTSILGVGFLVCDSFLGLWKFKILSRIALGVLVVMLFDFIRLEYVRINRKIKENLTLDDILIASVGDEIILFTCYKKYGREFDRKLLKTGWRKVDSDIVETV